MPPGCVVFQQNCLYSLTKTIGFSNHKTVYYGSALISIGLISGSRNNGIDIDKKLSIKRKLIITKQLENKNGSES